MRITTLKSHWFWISLIITRWLLNMDFFFAQTKLLDLFQFVIQNLLFFPPYYSHFSSYFPLKITHFPRQDHPWDVTLFIIPSFPFGWFIWSITYLFSKGISHYQQRHKNLPIPLLPSHPRRFPNQCLNVNWSEMSMKPEVWSKSSIPSFWMHCLTLKS